MAQETGIEPKPVLPALILCLSGFPDRKTPPKNWCNQTWQRNLPEASLWHSLPGRKGVSPSGSGCRSQDIVPRICRRLEVGSSVCSDPWTSYTGIATKGWVHGRVKPHVGECSDSKGKQINGLAGFRLFEQTTGGQRKHRPRGIIS